ncbi:LuxR family transcriptional regulator [Bradyrhizobium manausense]
MHRIFQTFIDLLSEAENAEGFRQAMDSTVAALDLSCFAYLSLPNASQKQPRVISTYPIDWTTYYLRNHYERVDPIVIQALQDPEPFRWGSGLMTNSYSSAQRKLLDQASEFGIRFGFTIPIHDGRGPIAALTFATDLQRLPFEKCIDSHARVLQLIALYFHAHVRRKLSGDHCIGEVRLSPRELECLEWAAQGKSAWEIGCILGISRNTVAYYLENAKKKLGVRTIAQAVTRLAAANRRKQN